MTDTRIEHDSMGEIAVPADKYWSAQTERSRRNFSAGDLMPYAMIRALAMVKYAAALANFKLGVLNKEKAVAIEDAAEEIISGELEDHFPLHVYQTGSGTQTNMNVNEVIANRANEMTGKALLHPNDDVNRSQSSNDVFPTAMNIAAVLAIVEELVPAAKELSGSFRELEEKYADVTKIGRTHLQDATPLSLGDEISGWRSSIDHDVAMLEGSLDLKELAIGGTAVGSGINAPEGFDKEAVKYINDLTGMDFVPADNKFYALTSRDAFVFSHGAVKALAADLMKIANDIRMLSSGPRCGIGELRVPANEPGSSIMPGKVNPTQAEAVTMAAARVMGNDVTIGVAASQGNYELNVYGPVMIDTFLESCGILAEVIGSFNERMVKGIEPDLDVIRKNLENSLMLVTYLSPEIGYEKAAEIANKAYEEGSTLKEAALEIGYVTEEEFDEWVTGKIDS